jgi:archaeosine-15-forming tRNA-guanine transglycosylase
MKRLPVQVECYAGSRADERPRRVHIEGRQYTVARLLSSSIEQALTATARVRRFRVVTEEGWQLALVRTADGDWFLEGKIKMRPQRDH